MQHATLDDRRAIDSVDKSGMLSIVAGLGRQLGAGFEAGRGVGAGAEGSGFDGVVVCGMGGSGIAGDVARSLYGGSLAMPLVSSKGYGLPGFCGPKTLVAAVSYSGNTEETLAAYEEARGRGCTVLAICGGGELAERAAANGDLHVAVPTDLPMPRAAVGYLSGAMIGALGALGLAPADPLEVERAGACLDDLAERLGPDRAIGDNEAKSLALWLAGRTAVIWGSEGVAEAAALRWKNQLNENAKVPAFCSVLPELDHNEIEGWSAGTGVSFGLVVLRHGGEHPRIAVRVDASLETAAASGAPARQVWAEGTTPVEHLLSLMMKADFASIYVAVLRGVDPTPVPVLMGLKDRLRP
jgi:glucose/mannose-6-phosphate isomerase